MEKVKVFVSGIKTPMEGFLIDGQTYIPLRPIFEALGMKVEWDGEKKEVHVSTGPADPLQKYYPPKLTVKPRSFALPLDKMKDLRPVDVKYLVVHHSDSPDVSAAEIDRWHKAKSWAGIGYHAVIRKDGAIEEGRPLNKMGSHCLGLNHASVGVVLAGDFTKQPPAQAQLTSLELLLKDWKSRFPKAIVIPHRDARKITPEATVTQCPGNAFPWGEFIKRV